MSETIVSPWWTEEELGDERWSDLIAPVLERLVKARDADRMPRSLLLVGPARLGRERAAVELAALLTCPERGAVGCGCGSCRRVRAGVHPDVALLRKPEKKKHIVIEQIRDLVEAVAGRPFEGVTRVWIIDGVEDGRLGREAANAFLKTLEEPPDHARLVLLAANPEAVLPTIRSRCQRLDLPGPSAVAARLGAAGPPAELTAAAFAGTRAAELVTRVKAELAAASRGDVLPLLRSARMLQDDPAGYQAAALAAVELAAEADGDAAEDLVRLAADLLAAERRGRALNLQQGRQLLACLLGWYRGRNGPPA